MRHLVNDQDYGVCGEMSRVMSSEKGGAFFFRSRPGRFKSVRCHMLLFFVSAVLPLLCWWRHTVYFSKNSRFLKVVAINLTRFCLEHEEIVHMSLFYVLRFFFFSCCRGAYLLKLIVVQ